MISYISIVIIPIIASVIIIYGFVERKNVFDLFSEGVKDGFEIVIKLFPTLLGIFLAVGMLNSSGIFQYIAILFNPLIVFLKIPQEIFPLILLRPISGSASLSIATNIMKDFGADSLIGLIASTIMGATETTIYTIAIYTSSLKIKKIRFVLLASLIADITGILVAVVLCRLMSNGFC